ncbi:CocE/NonD family hydrolase C-terminal non-catalytic domain-containing protein [Mesorhizobium sp. M0435]|uniref:CocE/NonD family hydrolase C-terminal non-catalytic domain-containing protein n=1 Tax=Mesorhizobium sp. M0435 TaxID=2956944 RepID=UPI00333C90BE
MLNLTHRHDDLELAPMTPGKPETVRMKLRCCGQRFEKGQRIRLAIATGHWPIVFPSPERATLSIYCAASSLILPVRRMIWTSNWRLSRHPKARGPWHGRSSGLVNLRVKRSQRIS